MKQDQTIKRRSSAMRRFVVGASMALMAFTSVGALAQQAPKRNASQDAFGMAADLIPMDDNGKRVLGILGVLHGRAVADGVPMLEAELTTAEAANAATQAFEAEFAGADEDETAPAAPRTVQALERQSAAIDAAKIAQVAPSTAQAIETSVNYMDEGEKAWSAPSTTQAIKAKPTPIDAGKIAQAAPSTAQAIETRQRNDMDEAEKTWSAPSTTQAVKAKPITIDAGKFAQAGPSTAQAIETRRNDMDEAEKAWSAPSPTQAVKAKPIAIDASKIAPAAPSTAQAIEARRNDMDEAEKTWSAPSTTQAAKAKPTAIDASKIAQAAPSTAQAIETWRNDKDEGEKAWSAPSTTQAIKAKPTTIDAGKIAQAAPSTAQAIETRLTSVASGKDARTAPSTVQTADAQQRTSVSARESAWAAPGVDAEAPSPGDTTVAAAREGPEGGSTPSDGSESSRFVEELVQKALATSPAIREARANWQASAEDINQTKGQRWPQVQVGVASPTANFGSGSANSPTSAGANISVTTPVFDWGRLSSTIASQTEKSKAVREGLEQVRQGVAYETTAALIELRRYRKELELSQAYVKRMDQLVTMLSQITESDRGRASELTQARARRLQAIASRDQIAAKMRETQVTLAKLVGEEVQLPANMKWGTGVTDLQMALSSATEHPAVRQARAEAKSAGLYADAVKASRLPQVNWVVSKTTQTDGYGNRQPWSTNLALQWNVFQGGSSVAAQRAAYERANAGEEKANAASRDLEYRLRTAAEQRDAAASRASEYTSLIKETDRVRGIFFEQWYHLGKRTLLDVLIAENDHYNNQIAQVNNRFDAQAADLRIRADSAMLLPSLPAEPAPGKAFDLRAMASGILGPK
ncbi:TolC family protein [Variovorax sp. J22R133]|uniref:TolC family protein n=1 Tax=Variovorax brevis TaxID=3053503 RepID=UPI002574B731|nr:TolC family protein [Variovorax sp. J22R133]MDM0115518.1 TolC family protein [Variovorax sp. J22R133]